VGGRPESRGGDELQWHQGDVPGDTGHAGGVVSRRADGAGHVRAMAVVVVRIVVPVDEVPAVNVVDVPVAVVIDPVRRDLAGIGPDIGGEIRVVGVHARVDHGHDDR